MFKPAHIEFAGRDGSKLKTFYSGLFGWNISRKDLAGCDYFDIETDGEFSAGIRHEPEGNAEIVLYFEVDDLNDAVAQAQSLGATVRIPPMEHEGLRFALISDPEGNPVGLTQAKALE